MPSLTSMINTDPISASEYNKLHLINDGTEPIGIPDLDVLAHIIHKHGMNEYVCIHLLHRHFDLPKDHVLASQTVSGLELHLPLCISNGSLLYGTQFLLNDDGHFQPYEFSLEAAVKAPTISEPRLNNFLYELAAVIKERDLRSTVALQFGVQSGNQREIVGGNWPAHYDCCLSQACLKHRTIAVGWRVDQWSGQPQVCTNWYIVTGNPDVSHRVGNGGDSIEPLIDFVDSVKLETFVSAVKSGIMCC